jgi:hypothetical protein
LNILDKSMDTSVSSSLEIVNSKGIVGSNWFPARLKPALARVREIPSSEKKKYAALKEFQKVPSFYFKPMIRYRRTQSKHTLMTSYASQVQIEDA